MKGKNVAGQLRALFAKGVLRPRSGKGRPGGKRPKPLYNPNANATDVRNSGRTRKNAALSGQKSNAGVPGNGRFVIGGKTAGLRGGGGASRPAMSRADRIAAGKRRGAEWQQTARGQQAVIGLTVAKRNGATSNKEAARSYNAARKKGDFSATRSARVAVGREKALNFLATKVSASKLGNYQTSTELLGMSRRTAAQRVGLGGLTKKGQAASAAKLDRERARAGADRAKSLERGARIDAGRTKLKQFLQTDRGQLFGGATAKVSTVRAQATLLANARRAARSTDSRDKPEAARLTKELRVNAQNMAYRRAQYAANSTRVPAADIALKARLKRIRKLAPKMTTVR